jgi:hypothetical protein
MTPRPFKIPVIPESAQRLSGTQEGQSASRKAAWDSEITPPWVPALRAARSGRDDGMQRNCLAPNRALP